MKSLFSILLLAIFAVAGIAQSKEAKKFGSDAEVPKITVEAAKKAFDEGSVVFIDSRAADAYKLEHIKGALLIEGAGEDRFDALPKGKTIVVYCSCPAENSSARLAFQMNQKGIANVYALKGGFQGWKAAGHPTATKQ